MGVPSRLAQFEEFRSIPLLQAKVTLQWLNAVNGIPDRPSFRHRTIELYPYESICCIGGRSIVWAQQGFLAAVRCSPRQPFLHQSLAPRRRPSERKRIVVSPFLCVPVQTERLPRPRSLRSLDNDKYPHIDHHRSPACWRFRGVWQQNTSRRRRKASRRRRSCLSRIRRQKSTSGCVVS